MTLLFVGSTLVYVLFLLWVILGVLRNNCTRVNRYIGISLIIAARNEEKNLPNLLQALSKLDYPPEKYEVIIVNDHSTDKSMEILANASNIANLKIIDNIERNNDLIGKKAAIARGIKEARFDVLAFTDADCLPNPKWLEAISFGFSDEVDYMLGYTLVKPAQDSSLYTLKNFERSLYYALAAAGLYWKKPITSSASNMIYRKSVFEASGGFEGIGHIRSGDDDLLLYKMMPQIRKAVFNPHPDMQMISIERHEKKQAYEANIRKASKLLRFPLWLMFTALFVFGYFISVYVLAFTPLFCSKWFFLAMMIKGATEIALMASILLRLNKMALLLYYPLMLLYYPLKFVYFGFRGTIGKYKWKELHLD